MDAQPAGHILRVFPVHDRWIRACSDFLNGSRSFYRALGYDEALTCTRKYFSSKSVSLIIYGTLIPSSLLLLYFTFRVNSVVIRGVIIGLLILPCFLAISLIAIRFREPETRSLRYGFATALLITALLWTMIIVRAMITPGDHSLSGPDPVNPIFFIVTILMDIVSTVFFLLLNMARSQTELPAKRGAVPEPCGQPS